MCYEYSGWFDKARAKELRKAQDKLDAAKKSAQETPVKEAEPAPEVREPERVPA
jgi:hypothetical protein